MCMVFLFTFLLSGAILGVVYNQGVRLDLSLFLPARKGPCAPLADVYRVVIQPSAPHLVGV